MKATSSDKTVIESAVSASSSGEKSRHTQQSIDCYLRPKKQTDAAIDKLIVEMVAVDGQPWTVVEDIGFRRLLETIAPHYEVKSEWFYRNKLPDLYLRVRSVVKELVAKLDSVAITTDIWTDKGIALLSLTVHGVDSSFNRFETVLAACVLEEAHTATKIAESLSQSLGDWGLCDKVLAAVTDHARNMENAIEKLSLMHIGCAAHKLNLIVQESLRAQPAVQNLLGKCRSVVNHFHHSSSAQAALKKIQTALNLPLHKLVMEVTTRWNSTLHMLQRIDEQMAAIATYSVGKSTVADFSTSDQNLLKVLIRMLEIFDEMTNEVSKSTTSASFLIPLKKILLKYLTEVSPTGSGLTLLHDKLMTATEMRFKNFEDNPLLATATALDPRFKLNFFESPLQTKELVFQTIESMLDADTDEAFHAEILTLSVSPSPAQSLNDGASSLSSPPRKKTHFENMHSLFQTAALDANDIQAKTIHTVRPVLETFFEARLEPANCDPLVFWTQSNPDLPVKLKTVVRKLFAIPATSVASERMFSTAGYIFNDKRAMLKPENLEKLLFCKANLPLVNFTY